MAELVDALDSGSSRGFPGGCSSHLDRKSFKEDLLQLLSHTRRVSFVWIQLDAL